VVEQKAQAAAQMHGSFPTNVPHSVRTEEVQAKGTDGSVFGPSMAAVLLIVTPLLCLSVRQEGRIDIQKARVTDALQIAMLTENIP
jgi:hypothetical protein